MKTLARFFFAIPATAMLVAPAGAVSPKYFIHDTAVEFERGDLAGVSITHDGSLRLAPRADVVAEPAEPYVWDLAVDARNDRAYLGTGDDGWVLRLGDDGAERFFQCAALEVLSVVVDGKGRIFAGTAPEGFVYRIEPDGEGELIFDAEEPYVWDMVIGPDGMIYAGYGPGAVVYRIDPETGEADRFFEIDDHHVVSLGFDDEGRLLLGTEGRGLVVRVAPDGKGRVLHDTPQGEVRAVLAGADGTVWAAASSAAESRESATADESADGTAPEDNGLDYSFEFHPSGPDEGILYRIDADGNAVRHWESGQGAIFDLALADDGRVLAATGDDAGLWSIELDGGATLLHRSDAEQLVSIAADPGAGGHLFATANPSRVFRVDRKPNDSGVYTSEVLDARRPARWGRIEWTGAGGNVSLSVRSGDTDKPDATWTEWTRETKGPAIDLAEQGKARFLQWRLLLDGDVEVRRVRVSALENNVAPIVASVQVVPSGNRFYDDVPELRPRPLWQSLSGGVKVQYQYDNGGEQEFPPEQRAPWTQGMRQVRWEAIDPNEDFLLFSLSYRREDETRWKEFVDDVDGHNFAFNSNGVPDGDYRIRVTASDERSNPTDPRTTTATSEPFIVDNTSPGFHDVTHRRTGDRVRVSGSAVDAMSDVVRLEISVNGGDWKDKPPVDGLYDSPSEDFDVTVEAPADEESSILLRATDLGGNLGTSRVLLRP